MRNTIFLPIVILAFLITSCQKEEPVLQGENSIIDRIKNSADPSAEILAINTELGLITGEDGNLYQSEDDYQMILAARNNPNERSATIYNEIESTGSSLTTVVYYYTGSWNVLAVLNSASVFVTCPSGFTLCNNYNEYYCETTTTGGTTCQTVKGKFWEGSTLRDSDTWKVNNSTTQLTDNFTMRIRDAIYSGPCCFNIRQYVLNGSGGCFSPPQSGTADCGWFE